jgi:hypothetical protein
MKVELAHAPFDQNQSVGVCDVHLSGGRLLNARRASVSPVPSQTIRGKHDLGLK